MIQRIEGAGPPEPRGSRRTAAPGPEPGRERGPGDRRLEIVLIVALGIVGTALGAVVFLQALSSDAARITFLDTATGELRSSPRLEHAALDPAKLHADVRWLADPARQGRDTPSRGLRAAQAWVAGRLAEAGAAPVAGLDVGTEGLEEPLARYAHLYASDAFGFGEWQAEEVDAEGCELVVDGEALVLERDFVPLTSSSEEDPRYRGGASGPPVFCGFGIDSSPEDHDDFRGLELDGAIAVVLDGEPSSGFAGSDVTAESSVWNKLDALVRKGAAGALVVSRHGARYRASRARWMPPDFDKERAGLPTLVVSEAAAERILGAPVRALREACSEAPLSAAQRAALLRPAAAIRLAAATRRAPAELVNVVGLVPGTGSGAALVVVAHLDHIGVGPRGRIGHGADDNGSGVAAALGMLEAVAAHPLRRPVVFAFPSGEEDGLLGSRALRADLADAVGQPGLCISLDMVGRGDPGRAVLLRGADVQDRPALDRWIESAVRSPSHGFAEVQRVDDRGFFTRSDHYAFYEAGVPAVFLFETWPLDEGIYHTWRDVPEHVSPVKLQRTARLALLLLDAASGGNPASSVGTAQNSDR